MKLNRSQPKSSLAFFADAMLGRLARWLRMLGYDTAYERHIKDVEVVRRVLREDRWLLTRDRYLVQRKILQGRYTLIHSDYLTEQLRQLRRELELKLAIGSNTRCRCPKCNHPLEGITVQEAAPHVPRFVAHQYSQFAACRDCQRLYWPGTHWIHLQQQLEQLSSG